MNNLSLTILPETPQDEPAIERLHERSSARAAMRAPPFGFAKAPII